MATTLNLMFNSKNIAAMKKLMKSLMLFAAAAMALTSCDNEGLNEGIENNDTFTLAFTADAPQSRTSVAISGEKANFSWSVDENGALTDRVVFLQTQNANNNVNTKYSDKTESSIKDGVATFVTEFTAVEGATSFNYCAIYPAQNISSNVTLASVGVSLPYTQTLTEDTYAPAADLMMSKVITGVTAKDGHGGNLEFTRLAAIGKMTLKGVEAGETIKSVKLTFANHVLAGDVTLNFNELTATYATSGSSSIELNNGTLVAEEENVIYFTCFPGTYSGAYRVDVTTDVATYYKEGNLTSKLTFTAGDVTGFSAQVEPQGALEQKTFTKVTSNLTDGTYLLVYEAGNLAFNGALTTLDAVNNTVSVEITDNQITGDFDANVFEIATVSGGYTIKSASGYYIGQTSDANGLASSKTTAHTNTITFDADGTANIISSGGAYLRYNATSGQERFRYFKSGSYTNQKAIALYRLETAGSGEEVEKVLESITVTDATTTFAVGSEEFVFDGTVTAHYTDGTTAVVTDKAAVDGNEVNMATAGEYTVTVTYEGKTFEYTVTVSEPTVPQAISIAEFIDKSVNFDVYYQLTGTITSITNETYGNITIEDESGEDVYVFGFTKEKLVNTYNDKSFGDLNLKVGDVVTLCAIRNEYDGSVQAGGTNGSTANSYPAYYVSHYGITAKPASTTIEAEGGSTTIEISSIGTLPEATITYTAEGEASVVLADNLATVTFGENTTNSSRATTITFSCGLAFQTVTITQKKVETPGSQTYEENFDTWTNNTTSNTSKGTTLGNACSWSWVGASKQYWINIYDGSELGFAITLLKPAAADGTYVLSETLNGGIKSLTLTARSNNISTGVNVYVIDVTNNKTHTVGTLNTTSKKTDFTKTWDLTSLGVTGQYQIKIANKSTAAYCCIGGLTWSN